MFETKLTTMSCLFFFTSLGEFLGLEVRSANSMADILAKQGVDRVLFEWLLLCNCFG